MIPVSCMYSKKHGTLRKRLYNAGQNITIPFTTFFSGNSNCP